MIQLGIVWVEVLRPYTGAVHEEGEAWDEEEVQQDDADDSRLEKAQPGGEVDKQSVAMRTIIVLTRNG